MQKALIILYGLLVKCSLAWNIVDQQLTLKVAQKVRDGYEMFALSMEAYPGFQINQNVTKEHILLTQDKTVR